MSCENSLMPVLKVYTVELTKLFFLVSSICLFVYVLTLKSIVIKNLR